MSIQILTHLKCSSLPMLDNQVKTSYHLIYNKMEQIHFQPKKTFRNDILILKYTLHNTRVLHKDWVNFNSKPIMFLPIIELMRIRPKVCIKTQIPLIYNNLSINNNKIKLKVITITQMLYLSAFSPKLSNLISIQIQ